MDLLRAQKFCLIVLSTLFLTPTNVHAGGLACEKLFDTSVIEKLQTSKFNDDLYSKKMFEQLQSTGADKSTWKVLKQTKPEIIQKLNNFTYKNQTGEAVQVNSDIVLQMHDGVPELSLVGNFELVTTRELIGFFVFSFQNAGQSHHPFLDLIKMDLSRQEGKGIANEFIPFLSEQLLDWGFDKMYLEADWLGRIVWAKKNFEFDPDVSYTQDGRNVGQLELARENFKNFLIANNLQLNDLAVQTKSELRSIKSIEDLKLPSDFINVVHTQGQKIRIKPYIDEDTFAELTDYDVGMAFSLGDYTPDKKQKVQIKDNYGDSLSNKVLFNWRGFLRLR